MKNVLILITGLCLSSVVSAQVKFNLSYQEDTKVYTVSILPEQSWAAPKNMLASAQVVLCIDAGMELIPSITSAVPGLMWADNAYVEQPSGASDHAFVCISLVNGPSAQIPMIAGQEVPIFSFVNTGGACAGKVLMLANDDPMVLAVREAGYNITQYFAVLGAHGNAFTGFENNEVDCSASSGVGTLPKKVIDDVKIAPVPTDKAVQVQWTLLSDQVAMRQLVIFDQAGREVYREKINDGAGHHSLTINVEHWQAGMYSLRFVLEGNQQTQSWNLMVIH